VKEKEIEKRGKKDKGRRKMRKFLVEQILLLDSFFFTTTYSFFLYLNLFDIS